MPTYEYLCQTCRHHFETWQKMTDEPLTTCPECGGAIRRVLFPAGIVFKGHGFYKTDNNNDTSLAGTNGSHESNGADGASSDNGKSKNGKSESSSTTASENKAASSSTESKASSESKTTTSSSTK